MFFKPLEEETIVIATTSFQNNFLKTKNDLINYKFFSKEELLDILCGKIDMSAILYVKEKHNLTFDLAKEILSTRISADLGIKKLEKFKNIIQDAKDASHLAPDNLTINYLKNRNAYVLYSEEDVELKDILSKLAIKPIYVKEEKAKGFILNKFKNIEEEMFAAITYLGSLLEKGINLKNIYIYNPSEEYRYLLDFYLHSIGLTIEEKVSLFECSLYKKYVKLLKDLSFEEAYSSLKEELDDNDAEVFNALTTVINDTLSLNKSIEVLDYLAKNKMVKVYSKYSKINLCSEDYRLNKDDYLIILGFYEGSIPRVYIDNDIISDKDKLQLNKNTSSLKTKLAKEDMICLISSTPNAYLSYPEQIGKLEILPSTIASELNIEVKEGVLQHIYYSQDIKNRLEKLAFEKNKYYADNLIFYKKQKQESFDYSYQQVDKNSKYLSLSASKIEDYMDCPYKYYLKNVLKLCDPDENFNIKLGNLAHMILEASVNNTPLPSKDELIKEYFNDPKEVVFADMLIDRLEAVVVFNQEFLKATSFTKVLTEEEYDLDFNGAKIKGKMDLVLINPTTNEFIVIDYKTGIVNLNYKTIMEDGMHTQLITYLWLISKASGLKPVGCYHQLLYPNPHQIKDGKYQDVDLRLKGFTLRDKDVFKRIDASMELASKYLKIGLKKDGDINANLSRQAINEKEFDELFDKIELIIEHVIKGIKQNEFPIKPFDKDVCKYCFRNICQRKLADFKNASLEEE